jgi:hypothetical protein
MYKITKINDVSVHVQNCFVYNRGIHDNDKLNYIHFFNQSFVLIKNLVKVHIFNWR